MAVGSTLPSGEREIFLAQINKSVPAAGRRNKAGHRVNLANER
jgi:hypothetical protein